MGGSNNILMMKCKIHMKRLFIVTTQLLVGVGLLERAKGKNR